MVGLCCRYAHGQRARPRLAHNRRNIELSNKMLPHPFLYHMDCIVRMTEFLNLPHQEGLLERNKVCHLEYVLSPPGSFTVNLLNC
jgi:hypothetical protein